MHKRKTMFNSKKGFVQALLGLSILASGWFWLGLAIFILIIVAVVIIKLGFIIGAVAMILGIILMFKTGNWKVGLIMMSAGVAFMLITHFDFNSTLSAVPLQMVKG